MFFNNDEDDSDFLSPTGGSKLANLFGVDSTMSKGGNESLTYTAPKEPKKKKSAADEAQSSSTSANSPTLLHALAAQTYKFVDGKSVSQGKLGVALLGNHAEADYKILVYRTKQEQITHVSVGPTFKLSIHANNYASFYDDQRQGWSLMFESEQSLATFAKEVGLAVAGSAAGNIDKTITQDLVIGEGGELEVGDSAEVRYTGWLFKDNALGDVYDSNASADKLLRLKLGKGKAIKGWEDGMLGMRKGGKRLLVIPPSLGYGAKGNGTEVPPNSTLAIEFEMVRVKLAKDKDTASIADSVASNSSDVNANPAGTDETVKAKTKNIDEQLNKGGAAGDVKKDKTDKARLISRMAKMGQAMLPGMNNAGAEGGEGEEEEEEEDSQGSESAHSAAQAAQASGSKPPIGAKPHAKPQTGHPAEGHYDLNPTMMQQPAFDPMTGQPIMPGTLPWAPPVQMPPQSYPMSHSPMLGAQPPSAAVFHGVPMANQHQLALYQNPMQQVGFPQMYPQPPQYPAAGSAPIPPVSTVATTPAELPVLLSESRQQNTEIRMSLTRMADKVDSIHSKMEGLQNSMGGMGTMSSMSAPAMETTVLLQNIQRIVAENEHLKKEVFERSARIEAQNEKINDLLQRNQKYVEQSNSMIEQRNDAFKTTATQSQHKVLTLEQEKVQLASELSNATSQLGNLQLELNGCKKNETELASQLDSAVTTSKKQLEELNSLRERLKGYEQETEEQSTTLKEEKLQKKRAESELQNVREELNDLRVSHDTLEKNFNEKRQKYTTEVKKLELELEELKQEHESEVTNLKERLRKQKTSTDVAAAEQVSQLEKELESDWKEKCDRLLANANERHQHSLKELKEEKEDLEQKVSDLEAKMSQAKTAKVADEKAKQELQGQVDDLQVWKEKYDLLRKQAGEMKLRYEERLTEVDEGREQMERQRDIAVQRAREAIAAARAEGGGSSQNVTEEVKKIMNTVYKRLKAQFDVSKSYKGDEIQKSILDNVKEVTLAMVQQQEEGEHEENEDENDNVESKMERVDVPESGMGRTQSNTNQSSALNQSPKRTKEGAKDVTRSTARSKDGHANGKKLSKTARDRDLNRKGRRSVDLSSDDDYDKSTDDTIGEQPPPLSSESEDSDWSDSGQPDLHKGHVTSKEGRIQANSPFNDGWITASEETYSDGEEKRFKENKEHKATPYMHGSPYNPTQPPKYSPTPNQPNAQATLKDTSAKEPEPPVITKFDEKPSNNVNPLGNQSEDLTSKVKEPEQPATSDSTETKPANEGIVNNSANNMANEKLDSKEENVAKNENVKPADIEEQKEQPEKQLSSNQMIEPVIEAPIRAVTAHIAGDRGNPHYAKELREAGAAKEEMMTTSSANLSSAPPGAKGGKPHDDPKKAQVCGDKGNPYYLEELVKAAEQVEKVEAKQKKDVLGAIEGLIISSEAAITGDKGNVKYGEELSKGHKDEKKDSKDNKDTKDKSKDSKDKSNDKSKDKSKDSKDKMNAPIKEEVMQVQSANLSTSGRGAPSKDKTDTKKDSKTDPKKDIKSEKDKKGSDKSKEDALKGIEAALISTTASIQGDKGNVHYAEELKKAAEQKTMETKQHTKDVQSAVEDLIMCSEAAVTGDKGNVHYGKELEKGAKGKDEKKKGDKEEKMQKVDTSLDKSQPPLFVKEEVMTQSSAGQSHGKAPSKDKSPPNVIEDTITAVTANIAGDRGNIHYAEELKKAGKDKSKDVTKSIEDCIKPVTASIAGDKGNPYYAAELRGEKIHEEKKEMPKKSASDILSDVESSILAGGMIVEDKSKQKSAGKSADKNQEKKPEKAAAMSADILSSIESSIIQDIDLSGPSKKESKGATKATPSSAKKGKSSSLFDDDDDKDLFGGEPFKKAAKTEPKSDKKGSDKKPSKKAGSDSEEDWKKPPPPPLFGDDDDEDDLNWLN